MFCYTFGTCFLSRCAYFRWVLAVSWLVPHAVRAGRVGLAWMYLESNRFFLFGPSLSLPEKPEKNWSYNPALLMLQKVVCAHCHCLHSSGMFVANVCVSWSVAPRVRMLTWMWMQRPWTSQCWNQCDVYINANTGEYTMNLRQLWGFSFYISSTQSALALLTAERVWARVW